MRLTAACPRLPTHQYTTHPPTHPPPTLPTLAAPCPQKGQRGVLVRRVEPTSAASAVLQQGDILLSFDGVEIGNDGGPVHCFPLGTLHV